MKKGSLVVLSIALLCGCTATTRVGMVAVQGGGSLYYEERGKGAPLLLLHGHSLDGRMWDEQFRVFARHYRVVRPDFRGYGRSSEQREDLPMTHADDVVTLMDSMHFDNAYVVGLSMGAFVAGDMLAMYPERLLGCVMASGGIRRGSPGPSEPMDSAESRKRDQEKAERGGGNEARMVAAAHGLGRLVQGKNASAPVADDQRLECLAAAAQGGASVLWS